MIGFGLRLTLRGGREAAVRLAITAGAVALGVGLLLVTLAAINGVQTQNLRYAWLNSGNPAATAAGAVESPDPLWGAVERDHHRGNEITRVDVAATGPRSPVPPGIPRLPGPGEYYASPALTTLLRTAPAAELGDRYPGRRIGTIGAAALPAPDSLLVIVGRTPAELSRLPEAAQVTSIGTVDPGQCSGCRYGTDSSSIALILGVTAAALLFPVLIFIGTATRLGAARREQRFAAMRLVGATPGQVSVVAAVETLVAAIVGTAVGFGLFFVLRPPLAEVPFTGDRFYPSDLTLGPVDVVLVAVGVPLAALIAALVAMRRVRISPLGVSRRVTPEPPRAWRLIPLVAGVAELGYFVGRSPDTTDGDLWAYLSGILLMMVGLVLAGPWLTMAGARLLARRTRRPATLIAGRRLSDNPQAGFRAISGLVLALFVTTTAVGVMTAFAAERGIPKDDEAGNRTLVADYSAGWGKVPGVPKASVPPVPGPVRAELRAIQGVTGVVQVHTNPLGTKVPVDPEIAPGWGSSADVAGLVSCAELAAVPGFGRCAPGAAVASVPSSFIDYGMSPAARARTVWPAAALTAAQLGRVPVQVIAVGTNGSAAAIERVRSVLAIAYPGERTATTIGENLADSSAVRAMNGYQRLVDVVVLVSLCVAGCSLAVSVVAGLNDRKRPFSLLRLTGVQLGMLRRIILLESVVPLVVVAVVAIGSGFLAAQLFLKSQLDYSLHAPGAGYYLMVLAGLAASLGLIASTLPLLRRITGPESARNG